MEINPDKTRINNASKILKKYVKLCMLTWLRLRIKVGMIVIFVVQKLYKTKQLMRRLV